MSNRTRISDVSFLLNDSLESFYWNGFLLADGCYSHFKNGNPTSLSLELAYADREHMEKLAYKLKCNIFDQKSNYDKTIIKTDKHHSHTCNIGAVDKELIPLICGKFDIKQKKTYNPPCFSNYTFTDDQILSLIVGYIDGDGSIAINNRNARITIGIHKSWISNLEFIRDFICRKFRFLQRSEIYLNKDMAFLHLTRSVLVGYMKGFIETNNLPVLSRKWDKISGIAYTPKDYMVKSASTLKKSVVIDNITFNSLAEAARYYSASQKGILSFINKNKFRIINE